MGRWNAKDERGSDVRLDAEEYQRVLGEELRELRRWHGWTRKALGERLDSDISPQTLATYELGTRQCSVVRLAELCLAMGEQPQQLLTRVQRRLFPERPGEVRVRLSTLVALDTTDPETTELAPLCRWARGRLSGVAAHESAESDEVRLDSDAIGWLAQLCGLDETTLGTRLRRLHGTA